MLNFEPASTAVRALDSDVHGGAGVAEATDGRERPAEDCHDGAFCVENCPYDVPPCPIKKFLKTVQISKSFNFLLLPNVFILGCSLFMVMKQSTEDGFWVTIPAF
jgi:hypothetical protein